MTELEKLQKYLDNYIDLIADRVSHYGYSIDQMKNIFGPYEKYMSDDLLKKYEDKLDFLEKEKLEKRNNFVDYKPRGAVKKFSGIHKLRRMKVELAAAGAVSLAVVGCSLNKNENYKYEESAEIQTERSYETNLEPETDAVVHTDLTAEQIKSTYANIIYNGRDNIAQALQNGIKISPEQYVHNYLIANIDHLTENEKLLMTSSDLIEINDLFDLSSQLSVVMMNTVNDNIPFNAYT